MPFKREESRRTLELTSLVDIVFLLLIFFLVSFAFSLAGEVSDTNMPTELDLPKTNTDLTVLHEDYLENLLIQIMPDTSGSELKKRAYVLFPAWRDTVRLTRQQAFQIALRDSIFADFEPGFLDLDDVEFGLQPACKLMTKAIREYVDRSKGLRRSGHPIVEVRAEQNTEFKILNFIMEQCSSYMDIVPQIIIRTIP